jgi:hypothetical protein
MRTTMAINIADICRIVFINDLSFLRHVPTGNTAGFWLSFWPQFSRHIVNERASCIGAYHKYLVLASGISDYQTKQKSPSISRGA